MRRIQNQSHQYPSCVPVNSTYYYDDADDYLGDYSESDALPEESPPMQPLQHIQSSHLTELYRRSPIVDRYNQSIYQPPNYYCKNLPNVMPQQMRRPAVPPVFKPPLQMVDERARYYSMGAIKDGFVQQYAPVYDPAAAANVRRPLTTDTATRTVARRHPVTVPTPKYYRRVPNNVYKKPSALCLPITSQRDPAVYNYRRFKKTLEEPPSAPLQKIRCPAQTCNNLNASSPIVRVQENTIIEENNETDQTDVSAVLAHYEKILGNSLKKVETNTSKSSVKTKKSKKRKLPHMRPKIPPSIKEKMHAPQENKSDERYDLENLEVEEMTTEVLDSMLTELINSGCENKLNLTNEKDAEVPKHSGCKGDMNSCSKSFNYNDIANSISRSQDMYSNRSDSPKQSVLKPCQQTHSSRISVESAMELHRSKSYIVNLIDRALSKELGTVVEDVRHTNTCQQASRCQSHNKCCDKSDKSLCLEIREALAETISNAPASHICQPKQAVACSCNNGEPPYVKQLRQLRYGHLKHIQNEVKRLEDLERFLDACSGDS